MTITFYGGAGGVTGSKHLLEVEGTRILLDCGTFQGLPDVRERNRSLPFAPDSVDAVILSHAHIDHCGMLPVLVRRGFSGSIFATPATCDVAYYMMRDMAGIEDQDAAYRRRHSIGAPDDREPLFTLDDVEATRERFVPVAYMRKSNVWQQVTDAVRFKFYDAGHILGSAVTVLEVAVNGTVVRIGYSGDLGQPGMPLLYDPQVPQEDVQTLLLESTYGSRIHEPLEAAIDRLAAAIVSVCERGGKIVMPAFALGRTQALVYVLHKLTDEGRIPRLPIYVDSPLATNLTEMYRKHRENYDLETRTDFPARTKDEHWPLVFQNLIYTRSVEESKALNDARGTSIVISASGMMTAGRVVHHLRHSISDARNAVFITGYQAEGTLGRQLVEGARHVELYGEIFPVRAQVAIFNEFSAHADGAQLQRFAEQVKGLQRVILVHGEPHHAGDLKRRLAAAHPQWDVRRPNEGEIIEL